MNKPHRLKEVVFTFTTLSILSLPSFAETPPSSKVFTPESILPDGVDCTLSTNPYTGESGKARKGTAAATLNNIVLLNKLLNASPTIEIEQQIEEIIKAINSLIPSLKVVGMFDMFQPQEWLADIQQPGKNLVALLYLHQYPEKITAPISAELQKLRHSTRFKIIQNMVDDLIKKQA